MSEREGEPEGRLPHCRAGSSGVPRGLAGRATVLIPGALCLALLYVSQEVPEPALCRAGEAGEAGDVSLFSPPPELSVFISSHCARYSDFSVLSQNVSKKAVESSLKYSPTALEWFLSASDRRLWAEARKASSDSHCSALRAVPAAM